MMADYKKNIFFSLLFSIILLFSMITTGPVFASESENIRNPYVEDEWKFKSAAFNIMYEHEDEEIDYCSKNYTASGNTLSVEIIKETQESVDVLVNIELKNHTKRRYDIDYTELTFRVDKENNDATLIENDHPEEGSRLGFFPFWGFFEKDIYESQSSFHYVLGGGTDSVGIHGNSWISYHDYETMQEVRHNVGSSYFLRVEAEDKTRVSDITGDTDPSPFRSYLRMNFKQHEGRLYPTGGLIYVPAEFLIEDPTDERLVYIDLDYSSEQQEAIEYLETLPPFEEDKYDSETSVPKEILFLAFPVAIGIFGGYMAYKKKEKR